MQTSIPERPRSPVRCLLLGIASVTVLGACTKYERDYVSEAFVNCMSYARLIEDDNRETTTNTSTIIKDCDAYAQTLKTKED